MRGIESRLKKMEERLEPEDTMVIIFRDPFGREGSDQIVTLVGADTATTFSPEPAEERVPS